MLTIAYLSLLCHQVLMPLTVNLWCYSAWCCLLLMSDGVSLCHFTWRLRNHCWSTEMGHKRGQVAKIEEWLRWGKWVCQPKSDAVACLMNGKRALRDHCHFESGVCGSWSRGVDPKSTRAHAKSIGLEQSLASKQDFLGQHFPIHETICASLKQSFYRPEPLCIKQYTYEYIGPALQWFHALSDWVSRGLGVIWMRCILELAVYLTVYDKYWRCMMAVAILKVCWVTAPQSIWC